MFYDFKVGIWNKGLSTKVGGITIPGVLEHIKDLDVDIQPYSTALLLKDYGYNIEVNKRIFMDYDSAVKIGTVFYYVNLHGITEKYEVKTIINWDYLEVMALGI
ncbi:hypothetical protein KPL47_06870 [Clostridium estertheticum]|uniref:hypothetical protein n=1 Tax=Clostridium estertheticum TaxID=238834 RepID=UPI001C0B8C59|nr:hypothetical protein [Clostridium estertheticum]MBU3176089.1 hypothetical protein [Clostridium estertheticum]